MTASTRNPGSAWFGFATGRSVYDPSDSYAATIAGDLVGRGRRVSMDRARDMHAGITALKDLSDAQASALADALRSVAATPPPAVQ